MARRRRGLGMMSERQRAIVLCALPGYSKGAIQAGANPFRGSNFWTDHFSSTTDSQRTEPHGFATLIYAMLAVGNKDGAAKVLKTYFPGTETLSCVKDFCAAALSGAMLGHRGAEQHVQRRTT